MAILPEKRRHEWKIFSRLIPSIPLSGSSIFWKAFPSRFRADSITVLLGRNGAGKTTTLKSIIGLTPPRHGKVIFDGEEVQGKRAYDIAAKGIGYVPEHRAVFRNLSVMENLKIAEKKRGDLERKSDFIFGLFPDLKRLYKLPGDHLSGGQQQMLAVARALVADNKLLLIDEPSEGLAPILIEQMMVAIKELSKTTTILLVEQNFIMASQLGDHFILLMTANQLRMAKWLTWSRMKNWSNNISASA